MPNENADYRQPSKNNFDKDISSNIDLSSHSKSERLNIVD